MPKFIFVPQHCYAIITPNTPKEYQGLMTSGLSDCTGVMISALDQEGRYACLCHADTATVLSDPDEGIPGWIRFLRHEGCVGNIEIRYKLVSWPENPDILPLSNKLRISARGVISPIVDDVLRGNVYGKKILDVVTSLSPDELTRISIHRDDDEKKRHMPGLILPRNNMEPVYLRDAESDLSSRFNAEMEFTDFATYWGRVDQALQDKRITEYPPLCIFDSTHILTLEEMWNRYMQYSASNVIGQALDTVRRALSPPFSYRT